MEARYKFSTKFTGDNPILNGYRKFATWRIENKFHKDFAWDLSFYISKSDQYMSVHDFGDSYWITHLDLIDGFFYERGDEHGAYYRIDEEFDIHLYDHAGLITEGYGYKQIYKPKETLS